MDKNQKIGIIGATSSSIIVILVAVMLLVIMPMNQPHDPETIEWLNNAECSELKDWIESKKGTFEKYQNTAKGIYDFKKCDD